MWRCPKTTPVASAKWVQNLQQRPGSPDKADGKSMKISENQDIWMEINEKHQQYMEIGNPTSMKIIHEMDGFHWIPHCQQSKMSKVQGTLDVGVATRRPRVVVPWSLCAIDGACTRHRPGKLRTLGFGVPVIFQ
jgi:hypothetical protein